MALLPATLPGNLRTELTTLDGQRWGWSSTTLHFGNRRTAEVALPSPGSGQALIQAIVDTLDLEEPLQAIGSSVRLLRSRRTGAVVGLAHPRSSQHFLFAELA